MDEDFVRQRARRTLLRNGFIAVGLGLLQFLVNPCFLMSIAAAGAGLLAIREARSLQDALGEDYPTDVGRTSQILGFTGVALVGAWFLGMTGFFLAAVLGSS